MTKTKSASKKTVGTTAGAKKKQVKKKIIITSLAVGATGILGYFGWQYLKKRRQSKDTHAEVDRLIQAMDRPVVTTPELPKLKPKTKPSTASSDQAGGADDFPLKKGSRGANVRRLQEALIAKYGKSILPKYGADGDFGSELVAALKRVGLPITVTESTLNVLGQGSMVDASALGTDLYKAAVARDFPKTMALLQKLRTVEDYSKAGEQFKQGRINGVRQTIVNGLLNTFPSEAEKQKIKFEFLRIGLQFDGNKWSLSGIDGLPIMTVAPTTVWVNGSESVPVPARMVLGNEVSKKLDYTLFENKGKYFLVQTKSVRYL